MKFEDSRFAEFGLIAPPARCPVPDGPQTLAETLDAAVRRSPDKEALVGRHSRLSYAELDRRVDAAAAGFVAAGIAPLDRIAATGANGPDLVIAFLACMRIGAIWVGINTALAPPEKSALLRASQARLLLADATTIAGVAALGSVPTTIAMNADGGPDAWADLLRTHQGASRHTIAVDPWAPAIIAYTSGTTGEPKGVVHSQHNFITACASAVARGQRGLSGRRSAGLPMTIPNVMLRGPLLSLYAGGTYVCVDAAHAQGIAEWIDREKIESIAIVATVLHDLMFDPTIDPARLQTLTYPIVGGGSLPEKLRVAYHERFGRNVQFTYGLTEAPTVVAETDPDAPFLRGASGKALPHIDLAILDESGSQAMTGKEGEICLRAVQEGPWAGVYTPALGYWMQAEKSAALYRDGWMRTGDMGSLDRDGNLFVLDRRGDLIVRGGGNVYPADVERVLVALDAVAAAAVIGVPDDRLGERVAAVVELVPGVPATAPTIVDLRDACIKELAKYKVPTDWYVVETMPRNPMRKIVKPRLAAMIEEGALRSIEVPKLVRVGAGAQGEGGR